MTRLSASPEPIDLPALTPGLLQRGGDPLLEKDELLHLIRERMRAHPRSQQVMVGPSELGTPCPRRLGYKVAGVQPVDARDGAWKPTVGTAVHTWLEDALRAWNDAHTYDRFYLEERVYVGDVNGQPVHGKCDVYDRVTCTTVDWKVVGEAALKRYRIDGPGAQYVAQAHLYGRGFVNAGLPVDHVAVMFLPQNAELSAAHYWTEPYDEQKALDALSRASGVSQLVEQIGTAALPLLGTADSWCSYCPWRLPASTDLTAACPGHVEAPMTSVATPAPVSTTPTAA